MNKGVIYGVALLLSIITISAAFNQLQDITPKTVSVNDLDVEITTSKKIYHIGEIINGTVWLVNNTPQTVTSIRSILLTSQQDTFRTSTAQQ
jgi:hypothetical protein